MPGPASLRDLLGAFAAYVPGTPAQDFLAGLDWGAATPRQIVHAFFDRPPTNEAVRALEGQSPAEMAFTVFASPAFRQGLVPRLLGAQPGKRRILFVHLPKCAGTDFEQVLRQRGPLVHPSFESAEAHPLESLATQLRAIGRGLAKPGDIACGGHLGLRWYLDEGLFRFRDRLVTVVRDPEPIAVSFANYVVARFRMHPALDAIDVRGWAAKLGLGPLDPEMGETAWRDLALRVVTAPGMMPTNPLCSLLGNGTAAGAFAQMRRAAIEIATVETYDAWLAARWDGARSVRVNAQSQRIRWEDLSPAQRETIAAASAEDRVLMRAVRSALGDRLWTTGPQVVAAA